MIEVRPGIFVEIRNRGSNNIIVKTDAGLVMIDCPLRPSDALPWRRAADALGEVKYLIYTDHHPDHVVGSAWLPGTVVAHEGTRSRLLAGPPEYLLPGIARFDPASVELMKSWRARLPEVTFTEKLTLHLGSTTFDLIHLKGHTPNTIAVHMPKERVIFTGDNVLGLGSAPAMLDTCVHDTFATLDVIESMDYDVLIPGHGQVADRSLVAVHRSELAEVMKLVESAMADGMSRSDVIDHLRYADLHAATDDDPGYPPEYIEAFQRKSMANVYDQLAERGPIFQRS